MRGMEPWSPSYLSYGGSQARAMEIVRVQKVHGNVNSMFVGQSRPRPWDLRVLPAFSYAQRKKKKKKKSSRSGSWWNDPEMKRRRRVAKYKLYSVEGRFKASFKRGFRWIKQKCSEIAHRF